MFLGPVSKKKSVSLSSGYHFFFRKNTFLIDGHWHLMGSWQSLAAEEYGYAMLEVNRSNTIIKFLNSEGKAVDEWITACCQGFVCPY